MTLPQSILAADRVTVQTWREKSSPKGKNDGVYEFGVPPKDNANFAWVKPFMRHLAPQGMAGFVHANGSMYSTQSGDSTAPSAMKTRKANTQSLPRQRVIRGVLIEADLVDCVFALPGQLIYSTQIPVCLCSIR